MATSPRTKYVHSASSTTHGFNPNGPYYRTCCCHVRKITVGFSIFEIFLICFLLVAVIPDLNARICGIEDKPKQNISDPGFEPTTFSTVFGSSTITPITTPLPFENSFVNMTEIPRFKRQIAINSTTQPPPITNFPWNTSNLSMTTSSVIVSSDSPKLNYTDWTIHNGQKNPPLKFLHFITCECNVIWLILAVIHIISANVMFYGFKTTQWYFFIPHLIMRILTMVVVLIMISMLIIGLFGSTNSILPKLTWISTAIGLIFCLIYGYLIWIEIKCIHFVKLSKETGFSYSNTRPVGPPTLSLDEGRPQNQQIQTTTTDAISMQTLNNNRPATTDGTFSQPHVASTTLPPLRHTYGTGHIGQ